MLLSTPSAFAKAAKAQSAKPAKTAPCVSVYNSSLDQYTPEQLEILKDFEKLAGGPMVPSAWKSDSGTSVQIYASEDGKIWLNILSMPAEKFKGKEGVPQAAVDYAQGALKAQLDAIAKGAGKMQIAMCRENGKLYLEPVNAGDRIYLEQEENSTVSINFTKYIFIFSDNVKKVEPGS